MADFQMWRKDLEKRFKTETDDTTDRFQRVHKKIDNFRQDFNEEAGVNQLDRERNDARYEEIKDLINENDLQHGEMNRRHDSLMKRVEEVNNTLDDKLDDKTQRLYGFIEGTEKHLALQVETLQKNIDNIKFELVEVLDQKQENMQRQFDIELSRVKQKYEDAIKKVGEASNQLQQLFKKKVRDIKEKSALFFSKIEMKLKENNAEVLGISALFRKW